MGKIQERIQELLKQRNTNNLSSIEVKIINTKIRELNWVLKNIAW